MKKNLITVIILALVLANLILTAILVFTIIPQTKKSNQLIDQVCSAFNANGYQNVKDDILKTLQDMFGGSDFIVGVNFSSVQTE